MKIFYFNKKSLNMLAIQYLLEHYLRRNLFYFLDATVAQFLWAFDLGNSQDLITFNCVAGFLIKMWGAQQRTNPIDSNIG